MKKDIKRICVPTNSNTSIVAMFSPVGSRHETEKIKGISHFIEHLCFKGSKNRTCKEIAKSIENLGGVLNAYTSNEITCYWAKVANQYLSKAVDTISDLILNPLFPEKEIDKEREVIIQELKMYEDDPKACLYDLFNRTYFTEESSLHASVIGTIKTLHQINKKEILDYYNKYYQNITQIVIGKTNEFSYSNSYDSSSTQSKEMLFTTGNREKFEYRKNVTQANILIGGYTKSISNKTDDYFSLYLLQSIYNDMSGRLFEKIRERNNLCYRIKFMSDIFSDGLLHWLVSVGLEKNKISSAKNMILAELTRDFNRKEIEEAVQKAIGQETLNLDDVANLCGTIADSEIRHTNYKDFIYDYANRLRKAAKTINEFKDKMRFNKNLIVGVLPK